MSLEYPREAIRRIYDNRRERQERGFEPDEYDISFGKASTLEKAIIQYLDERKLLNPKQR